MIYLNDLVYKIILGVWLSKPDAYCPSKPPSFAPDAPCSLLDVLCLSYRQ